MKKLVVTMAAISLTAGGAALAPIAQAAPLLASPSDSVAAPTQVAYTPKAIKWGKCGIKGFDELGAECGYLTVPLDYAHSSGKKIKLAVSRIKHTVTADKYQGVMLVNPGGPGGSGLTLSVLGQYVPGGAGDAYDWIGFDPRGVGSSVPSLSCDGNYFKPNRPNYVPSTQKLETTWLSRSKKYAKACDKAGGALLNHVKTIDSVKDMDSLRKALGRDQINYYGFSYGTYLGQVYATTYPTRVRRAVFDGNVDPRGVWYKDNIDQDLAFDKSVGVYFGWVAKYDSVYHLGTTAAAVKAKYYAALKKLGKKPAGKLGPDEWNDVFVSAGYYVYGWEDVAAAFAAYVNKGDGKPALALFTDANPTGKGADNGFAMYLATQCSEGAWPASWYKWRVDNWVTYAKAPFITWNNAWFNAPCHYWGAKTSKPVTINGSKAPAILLINETLDAATPYSGALEVRSLFPKSVLIEGVGGTTHAGSLSGVTCTDDKIAAYLTDGTLPARVATNTSDVQCGPVPAPDPTAPAAAAKLKTANASAFTRQGLQQLIGSR